MPDVASGRLNTLGTDWPKSIPLKESVFDDQFGSRAPGAGCCRRCQRHRGSHVVAGADNVAARSVTYPLTSDVDAARMWVAEVAATHYSTSGPPDGARETVMVSLSRSGHIGIAP